MDSAGFSGVTPPVDDSIWGYLGIRTGLGQPLLLRFGPAESQPAAAVELSPSGSVTEGTEIGVTMSFANLPFDSNTADTDFIFRADVRTSDNEAADECEGHGTGVTRYMYKVDENPEVRTGGISASCPPGDYTLEVGLSLPNNVELASASADFSVAEPESAQQIGSDPEPTPTETPEPAVTLDLSPSGPVAENTEIAVTLTFTNLTFDSDRATTDYVFRADVRTSDNEEAGQCENQAGGYGLGVERYMYQVDEDPEVRRGAISADCPPGDYTLEASLLDADNDELASASADFSIVEPAPQQPEPPSTDATLSGLTLSGVTLAFDPATTSYAASVGNDVAETTVTPAA